MQTKLAFALGMSLIAAAACGKQSSQPAGETLPPMTQTQTQEEQAPPADKAAQRNSEGTVSDPADPDLATATVTQVDIDQKLAEMCGITEVFFKYDSAALNEDARSRLDSLATCLTTGPAKDKELLVVGRASPPGAEAHNQNLSESRAESVAKYLRSVGVNRSRVEIEAKGEGDASANAEVWPMERRVTVRLQE